MVVSLGAADEAGEVFAKRTAQTDVTTDGPGMGRRGPEGANVAVHIER